MRTGLIKGGIGHNLPQEAPQAFAEAVIDVDGADRADRAGPTRAGPSGDGIIEPGDRHDPDSKKCCTPPRPTPPAAGNGASRSSDGRLDVKLSSPGTAGSGTNPEQLFAAGWSACFIGAMGLAAGKRKVALPADLAIDAEVDLGTADGGYFLRARLNVSLPGLEREVAQALVDAAHQICPYSKATRGNIDVVINLV